MKPKRANRKKRDRLAREHLEWAHDIARRVAGVLPTWFVEDDLIGPAEEALLQAAERYQRHQAPGYQRPVSFEAYARQRVFGACIDSIRRREYKERGHLALESLLRPGHADDGVETDSFQIPRVQRMDLRRIQEQRTEPCPEAAAAAGQLNRVWAVVMRLPPRHALVILAVYGGEMTLEQLATKVDVKAARLSQIHREALAMLREACAELQQ